MKNILWVLTIILVVAGFVFPCMVFGGDSNALAKRLAYLKDLPEISWVKFDDKGLDYLRGLSLNIVNNNK